MNAHSRSDCRSRLLVVAHAPTRSTPALVFGDALASGAYDMFGRLSGRVASWFSGPRRLVDHCGMSGRREQDDLRSCANGYFGAWTGRMLADVGSEEPSALEAWLHHPGAAPYGGEVQRSRSNASAWGARRTIPGPMAKPVVVVAC